MTEQTTADHVDQWLRGVVPTLPTTGWEGAFTGYPFGLQFHTAIHFASYQLLLAFVHAAYVGVSAAAVVYHLMRAYGALRRA